MGVHQGLAFELAILSDVHLLGKLRGRPFQVRAERQSSQIVGKVQTQRENELREIQQSNAILLQDGRSAAGAREKACLQIRAQSHRLAYGQSEFQTRVLDSSSFK